MLIPGIVASTIKFGKGRVVTDLIDATARINLTDIYGPTVNGQICPLLEDDGLTLFLSNQTTVFIIDLAVKDDITSGTVRTSYAWSSIIPGGSIANGNPKNGYRVYAWVEPGQVLTACMVGGVHKAFAVDLNASPSPTVIGSLDIPEPALGNPGVSLGVARDGRYFAYMYGISIWMFYKLPVRGILNNNAILVSDNITNKVEGGSSYFDDNLRAFTSIESLDLTVTYNSGNLGVGGSTTSYFQDHDEYIVTSLNGASSTTPALGVLSEDKELMIHTFYDDDFNFGGTDDTYAFVSQIVYEDEDQPTNYTSWESTFASGYSYESTDTMSSILSDTPLDGYAFKDDGSVFWSVSPDRQCSKISMSDDFNLTSGTVDISFTDATYSGIRFISLIHGPNDNTAYTVGYLNGVADAEPAVYKIDFTGSGAVTKLDDLPDTSEPLGISWSSDGNKCIYINENGDVTVYELATPYVFESNTSNATQAGASPISNKMFLVAPDGKMVVYYHSLSPNYYTYYVMSTAWDWSTVDAGQQYNLPTAGGNVPPFWIAESGLHFGHYRSSNRITTYDSV